MQRTTALKIWRGTCEEFNDQEDNDMYLSNLRKAAKVLNVIREVLLPE